jgi:hypothetical protein
VDVEGWKATALKSALESMAKVKKVKAEHSVLFLPMFDVYVLTQSRNLEPVLAKEHKGKVFRPAAWVSAVVLVEGRIEGVWEHKVKASSTTVKVRMFASPTNSIREAIVAEAERLNDFLDTRVVVEFQAD